jgi:hypothetical protein
VHVMLMLCRLPHLAQAICEDGMLHLQILLGMLKDSQLCLYGRPAADVWLPWTVECAQLLPSLLL